MHPILASANIDLASSWSTFWSAISGSLGKIPTILGIIGMLLVVASILTYIWERRKSGGGGGNAAGGHTKVLWTLVIGVILFAPQFAIPAVLTIVDFAANAIAAALSI